VIVERALQEKILMSKWNCHTMTNAKKKSSGWRPAEKRRTPKQWQARWDATRTAQARRDCDRLRLWRYCSVRLCQRVRSCTGNPSSCMEQRRPKISVERNGDARPEAARSAAAATETEAARPVMSASEAAAAIAASIANQPVPLLGEELEAIVRDGHIHYEPRRNR
jgi:hypothetical protein